MAIVGLDGSWLEVNDKICKITGYSSDELTTFQDITYPEDLEKDLDNVRKLINGEIDHYCMEKRYIRKDKNIVWVRLSVSAVFDDDGKVEYFISQIEDVTNTKIMEYRQKLIFDEGHIGLAICDEFGNWLQINNRFANKLNYTIDELLSTNFQSVTHPDDLKTDLQILNGFLKGEFDYKKWRKRYLKKDGSHLWCLLNVIKSHDLETNRPIFVCSIQNIDDFIRLEKENEETNNQLLKTIEELTHFNYFAAHDLKESVRSIYNYCKMINSDSCKNEEKKFFASRMSDRSKHLNELINDLLEYSKISSFKKSMERFSAYHAIIVALEDYTQEINQKGITVNCNFDDDLHILCNKSIFHHLMTNFLSNSIKYSSKNIEIEIKVNKFKTLIKIIDDGEGVSDEFQKKVFDPFFRMSTKLNGTGLGLSLCKKMVEKLGGSLGLRSKLKEGSIFWFCY